MLFLYFILSKQFIFRLVFVCPMFKERGGRSMVGLNRMSGFNLNMTFLCLVETDGSFPEIEEEKQEFQLIITIEEQ